MPRSQTTLMAAREAAHPDMAVSEIAQLTASEAFQSLDSLVGAIYDGALSTPRGRKRWRWCRIAWAPSTSP